MTKVLKQLRVNIQKGGNILLNCLPSEAQRKMIFENLIILTFFVVVGYLIFTYTSGKDFSKVINCKYCLHLFSKKAISDKTEITDTDFLAPTGGYCMSITLKIEDFYTNSGSWRHIFHKGSPIINDQNINYNSLNKYGTNRQYPGLWLHPDKNNIRVCLSTANTDENEFFDILDVQVGKWVELSININERICEIYLDGKLSDTFTCQNNIEYSSGNCYFLYSGGSSWGSIKNFRYIPNYLNSDVFPYMSMVDKRKK